jgi:hypothetical protein
MELQGIDKRNFTKLKILIFLRLIKEQQGTDVYLSSGQIARATHSKYCTVRTLLLQRWNDREWVQYKKDRRTGQRTKRLRHGFRFVSLIDLKGLGGNADYRYGFKITTAGEKYLTRAQRKAENDLKPEIKYMWERKINTAYAEIARYNSPILSWYDRLARHTYFIREPFEVVTKNGVPPSEDFGCLEKDNPNVHLYVSMEEAFAHAAKLSIPPTPAFRAYVFSSLLIDQRETQSHLPQPQPVPDIPSPPVNKPVVRRFRINPAGAQRLEQYLNRPNPDGVDIDGRGIDGLF